MARLDRLPGWVIPNDVSVRREAEPYRGLGPARRLELGALACRSAAAVTYASPYRARALSYRAELPASTQQALARLRSEYRASRS